jgi:hypothetical protein
VAIDWILDYACQPKRVLGLDGVLDGSKLRQHAAHLAELQASGKINASDSIQIVKVSPTGTLTDEKLTVQQLHVRAAGYGVHAGHCRGCPANVLERVRGQEQLFGCHGTIDYPLSVDLEFLLHVTARTIADKMLAQPAARLLHFIMETGIDGDSARSARDHTPEEGPTFARRDTPIVHLFEGPEGEATVDTDQLIEALFFGGKIESQVASYMLAPFFDMMEKVIEIVSNERNVAATERLKDRGVIQLRAFGRGVVIAAELGCGILVDH